MVMVLADEKTSRTPDGSCHRRINSRMTSRESHE